MRQNRRRYAKTTSMNHGLTSIFAILALVLMLGGIATLSIKASISKTGREIAKLEAELSELRAERIRAEARWSACAKPEQLDAALARHGLKMTLARGERIVSLRGRRVAAWTSGGGAEVASNGTRPRN